MGDGRAFLVEALITFLLVFVIVAVATDARVPAAVAAPAIGFALIAAVFVGGGVTGGAVNPDRALGPAIMSGTYTAIWVYIVAPIVGGIAAAVLYDRVISRALAPTMTTGDQQVHAKAGDRSLATATDDTVSPALSVTEAGFGLGDLVKLPGGSPSELWRGFVVSHVHHVILMTPPFPVDRGRRGRVQGTLTA